MPNYLEILRLDICTEQTKILVASKRMRSARNRTETATVTKKQVTTGYARNIELRQKVFGKNVERQDFNNKSQQVTTN